MSKEPKILDVVESIAEQLDEMRVKFSRYEAPNETDEALSELIDQVHFQWEQLIDRLEELAREAELHKARK